MGLPGPYQQFGPLPEYDRCGYEVAYQMLLNSLRTGRNNPNYSQWDTIRRLRTAFSNQVRSSNEANRSTLAINDNTGTYKRIGKDICRSFWFARFGKGYQNQMGQETRQNRAFSIPPSLKILGEAEERVMESSSFKDKHRWSVFICYCAVS